jgi:hypothetical protein
MRGIRQLTARHWEYSAIVRNFQEYRRRWYLKGAMGSVASPARRALTALLLLSFTTPPAHAQQNPVPAGAPPEPAIEGITTTSALEPSKIDEIVELLSTSYAAHLTLKTALRTAECTTSEPNCAPLYFAQDVILGPWNTVRLLRMLQELPDEDVATIARPRDYETPVLPPPGVLPPEIVSLAEYTFEQQVALYEQLEAWQITLERYSAAVGSSNEPAAAAQRRALDEYSAKASTAAAGVSAASLQFLESLTPLIGPFASAIAVEDAEATKEDFRDNGFGPEVRRRFAALGIVQEDSNRLAEEIFALSEDAQVDLVEGLTAVAKGYDKLADVTTVPTDPAGNLRPLADAGPNQAVPANDTGVAAVELSGTRSTDPEAGTLEYVWSAASITALGPRPTMTLPLGTHHVALTVSDGKGGTDVDIVTILVGDAAAPIITSATATPGTLWPPNRQLVLVTLNVAVTDNDDPAPTCQVISVGVNAPANETGAAAEPDIVLNGSLTVLLRADPSGALPGRAYTVTVQCTDKLNHSSLASIFVPVSH